MPQPIQTVAELIDRIRLDIDEPLDASSNFWTDDELVTYVNEGMREVWQTVRETDQSHFVRTFRSNALSSAGQSRDPTTMKRLLYGREYDPTVLALRAGIETIQLPPDFRELVAFEPLRDAQGFDTTIEFHPLRQTHADYRMLARLDGPPEGGTYFYALEYDGGAPVMRLAPIPGARCDVVLRYVYGPLSFTQPTSDTLEGTGFLPEMIDALIAYAVWTALTRKPGQGNAQAISVAQATWQAKIGLVTRAAGPTQAVEPIFVQGCHEDELDWEHWRY